MNHRHTMVRATLTVAACLVLFVQPALGHNGEDHTGGSDPISLWAGVAGVMIVIALVYSLLRQRPPDLSGLDPDERGEPHDR